MSSGFPAGGSSNLPICFRGQGRGFAVCGLGKFAENEGICGVFEVILLTGMGIVIILSGSGGILETGKFCNQLDWSGLVIVMSRILLYKKKIDWSVFEQGFTIPIKYHRKFFLANREYLPRGQSRPIDLVWHGQSIKARLYNIDRNVLSDTLQIRYSIGKPISDFMKAIFQRTYIYTISKRETVHQQGRKRPQTRIPDDEAEYLYIYSTDVPYVYEIECETRIDAFYFESNSFAENNNEETTARLSLEQNNYLLTDEEIEQFRIIRFKDLASKIEKPRQLTRAGKIYCTSAKLKEDVKQHYDYTCQICSTQIKKIGWTSSLPRIKAFQFLDADAHHVKPLSAGGPDSPFNILCVCPNCHRRLHTGQFDIIFNWSLPFCLDIFEKTKYEINFRDGHKLVNY